MYQADPDGLNRRLSVEGSGLVQSRTKIYFCRFLFRLVLSLGFYTCMGNKNITFSIIFEIFVLFFRLPPVCLYICLCICVFDGWRTTASLPVCLLPACRHVDLPAGLCVCWLVQISTCLFVSNLHGCDADTNVQCTHSKCSQTGSVQTHPCTVYVCTAVILSSSPRWSVPVAECFKMENVK
jgi:hypothetical protein